MFEFVNQIWFIWLDLAPWMLLGMLLAGMLHVLVPATFFQRQLHGSWGVVKSVLFGIPLPLCSCG
ncbi:MAG TPA: SO_0444 family Cu/Zn efflux transporter, partial [Pirellulaceae bacterium]|nr:SO_0444 family Cu/Zn efflux transporter [Pirellulaceae bacterium]